MRTNKKMMGTFALYPYQQIDLKQTQSRPMAQHTRSAALLVNPLFYVGFYLQFCWCTGVEADTKLPSLSNLTA